MITSEVESKEMTFVLPEDIQSFISEARKEGKTVFVDLTDDQRTLKIKAEKKYRTTNYALAAFLVLKGFKLEDIVFDLPFIPQKGVFIFQASPEILEADREFFYNSTPVSIQDFIRETNKLKHLLEDRMNRRGVYKYGYKRSQFQRPEGDRA